MSVTYLETPREQCSLDVRAQSTTLTLPLSRLLSTHDHLFLQMGEIQAESWSHSK